jgi:hypothetical protein
VSGVAIALVVIVAVLALYAERQWHPTRRCPSCDGTGKNWGSTSKKWGICRRCGGRKEIRRFLAAKR